MTQNNIQIPAHMCLMRSLDGYENYTVSSEGVVYSKNGNKRKTTFWHGYERLILCKEGKKKTFYVHRLVASVFIPNPDNKPEVNHKDGDRGNNHVSNLEWVTKEENQKHSFAELGRVHPMKGRSGALHPKSKNYIGKDNYKKLCQ